MTIRLVTFGRLGAAEDAGELVRVLRQPSRAALLVYLAVERRVSREALTAIFWPESDTENARHALRQGLYQLRKVTGGDWIESRAHDLIVSGEVQCDAHDLTRAAEAGDHERVVALYAGPFLHGVHLVDLKGWEDWVDARRAQSSRVFRQAAREVVARKIAARDARGAIQTAERWVSMDPADGESHHRLIESLAAAGEHADAIRAYETYCRALAPDESEPLDETTRLVERLKLAGGPIVPIGPRGKSIDAPPREATVLSDGKSSVGLSTTSWRRHGAVQVISGAILIATMGVDARQPTVPASATVAVIPFATHGADSGGYLGDGMVNLLGAALDGAGSLRPVDTRAIFATIGDARGSKPDRTLGADVARRLGASMFVIGDVVQVGDRLQVEAALHHTLPCGTLARFVGRCRADEPQVRATVSGMRDSAFAIVDQLAARLLGGLGDPQTDRLRRTAATTTGSLEAFKSYIEGEEQMRAGRFELAAESYLAALARDSAFALAWYKLALAREWAPLFGEDAAAAAAARHGARLTTRDAKLLDAFRRWRAGDAADAGSAYREILARHPDDLDAWFQLGEIQFHHGPLFGRRLDASEEAWRALLKHEPRNPFAVTHLARLAVADGRAALVDSVLAPFRPDEVRVDRRLTEVGLLRAMLRGDTARVEMLSRDLASGESNAVWRTAAFLTAFAPDPLTMRPVIAASMTDRISGSLRADLQWFVALLEMAAGRLAAAQDELAKASLLEETSPLSHRRLAFGEITLWHALTLPLPFGATTLERAMENAALAQADDRSADFAHVLGMGLSVQHEALRHYTLGTLALRRGDSTRARIAANALERAGSSGAATALTRDLDRGLRARIAHAGGRPSEALALLESIEARDPQGDVTLTPFASRAAERYLHGEVLMALGRDAEALEWFASLGHGSVTEIALRAPALLRQAEIHERLGRPEAAKRARAHADALWRSADREVRRLLTPLPR